MRLNRVRKSQVLLLALLGVSVLLSLYLSVQILYWYHSVSASEKILNDTRKSVVTNGAKGERIEVVDKFVNKPKEPTFLSVDFNDLHQRNSEIVAWLRVDSVGINMPIVQTTDNEYYLDHDLDKKSNKLGWIFVDTRSNTEHLGMNTVLYGHNALNKQMFGSLKGLMNASKKEDGIIQLTTPNSQMIFQITSVYVTEYEDWRYVKQLFNGDEDKKQFINRIIEKNELKVFAQNDISVHDTFLTFSTCHGQAGTTKRLVVYARLIAEDE